MSDMIDRAGLKISIQLVRFIEERALPGTYVSPETFWNGLADLYRRFAPENAALLASRDSIQAKLDTWYLSRQGEPIDPDAYRAFLRTIGYIVDEPAPFTVGPTHVDDEVARLAGPQLVVPILNARFLLNAANARWGSLYDALYGTDVLPGTTKPSSYDAKRGAQVIAYAKAFLDQSVPLKSGSWAEFSGGTPELADPTQLVGSNGDNLLLRHHGLHIELVIDPGHPIGKDDPAGIADVVLESALTTICDLEDSVAAVDAEDKVAAYANWLGLGCGLTKATR